MQIIKIEIENFRSISEKIIINPASNLTVFIGANNVGKSNILRAINLFINKATEPNQQYESSVDCNYKTGKPPKISIDFIFDPSNDKAITKLIDEKYSGEFNSYRVPITLRCYQTNTIQYVFTNRKGQKKSFSDLLDKILSYIDCIYIPSIKDHRIIINQEFMKKIVAATFHGWGKGIEISKSLGRNKKKFQSTLKTLQGILNNSGNIASSIVTSVIPSINKFRFSLPYDNLEEFLGKLNFEIEEKHLSKKVNLDHEGSGVQSFTIITMLKLLHEIHPKNTFKKSIFIWLIEEPETFMHNDLQHRTFEKLKEYSNDGIIFITTHSPVFIDKKHYTNTYHVLKDKKTNIKKVTHDDIRKIISGSIGVSFSDYFLFNEYNILVEGETDKKIIFELSELLKRSGEPDTIDFDKTEIIVCGSANSIPHYYHMYNSFNRYASFSVLFDRDKSGMKAHAELLSSGIHKNKLILLPESDNKQECAIEDIVDKEIWDKCLNDLDSLGLITIKMQGGNIIDYEYEYKNRVKVKTKFAESLIKYAKIEFTKFSKYKKLIADIVNSFQ